MKAYIISQIAFCLESVPFGLFRRVSFVKAYLQWLSEKIMR